MLPPQSPQLRVRVRARRAARSASRPDLPTGLPTAPTQPPNPGSIARPHLTAGPAPATTPTQPNPRPIHAPRMTELAAVASPPERRAAAAARPVPYNPRRPALGTRPQHFDQRSCQPALAPLARLGSACWHCPTVAPLTQSPCPLASLPSYPSIPLPPLNPLPRTIALLLPAAPQAGRGPPPCHARARASADDRSTLPLSFAAADSLHSCLGPTQYCFFLRLSQRTRILFRPRNARPDPFIHAPLPTRRSHMHSP